MSDRGPEPLGFYVHVPFCEAKCSYCHFALARRCGGRAVSLVPAVVLVAIMAASCAGDGARRVRNPTTDRKSQSGFAGVEGGRLYYEMAGTGNPVVLIHGTVGDRRHWDRQFEALAKDFRVIRYDVRGFGRSCLPAEQEPYSDHEDLAALLDHLGASSAHIAGWSMGASIAVDFVLAYPQRAKSLVVVGPWVSGFSSASADAMLADMRRVRPALVEGGERAAVRAWMEAPFFAATIRAPFAGEEFARVASDHSFWGWSHRGQQRALEPPAVGRIRDIAIPTLILTADDDIAACREVADLLEKAVPRSRKVVMAGTGHLMHIEKPEEFNKHLKDFLAEVETGGGGMSRRTEQLAPPTE